MPIKELKSRVLNDLVKDCSETLWLEAKAQLMREIPKEKLHDYIIMTNTLSLGMQFVSELNDKLLSDMRKKIHEVEDETH